MKKHVFILLCALSIGSFSATAQSIAPEKGTIQYDGSFRPCIVVNLEPGAKTLKKEWVHFLKKEYDFKLKGSGFLSNKEMLYAEQILVERISLKQMDFYTNIVENEEGTQMKVLISFGYDIYVNEAEFPAEFKAMNDALVVFLKGYLPKYYGEKMKAATKTVNSLNKEIESITKDIDKNNQKMEEHKKDGKELEEEVQASKEQLKAAEAKRLATEEMLKRMNEQLEKL